MSGSVPARLLVAVLLGLAAASQARSPMTLSSTGILSAVAYRGFGAPESGFRWSGARGEIVFPDPGPGRPVRVEVDLSAWRPRGHTPPQVRLSAGGRAVTLRPGPGRETAALETVTEGWWRSDLVVAVDAETFEPGRGDPRRLGVRVLGARLVPLASGPHLPSAGAAVTAVASVLLLFLGLVRAGSRPAVAGRLGLAAAMAIALAHAFARPWAALLAYPALFVLSAALVAGHLAPRALRAVRDLLASSLRAWAAGAKRLLDPRAAVLAAAGALLVVAAYRAQPRLDLELGSGAEATVARGFGVFDAALGRRFRAAPRGAELDLGDMGGGTRWTIAVTASHEGRPRQMEPLRAGAYGATATLGPGEWTRASFEAPAPVGWRSGLVLSVPSGSDALHLARVEVDRGRPWPSLRIAAAVVGAGLLAVVGLGAAGLAPPAGLVAGGLVMAGAALAIARAPLAAIPFALPFLAITGGGTVIAAALAGTDAARRHPSPLPVARAAAALGWMAWLACTTFPLYRGGHFVFHSSIAEEIRQGRFLLYYLPYPGSMLSQQAQWGNVVVPHPALYQTLVSPLAAMPRPWFYLAEKVLLASLFASLVLVAARLAARAAGPRAAAFAAIALASLVPTFQLLGLGHLMTILGVWASAVALGWLAARPDRLAGRRGFWAAVGLLTFCFLSYTAALLFTGLVLLALIASSRRQDAALAGKLLGAAVAAGAAAFVLYYVHWTWPFLAQSVPKLLGASAGEPTPVLVRLSLQPSKLAYSYGALVVPLAGLGGLLLLRAGWERTVLWAWAAILPGFAAADLFFNFMLKHHYYVLVPVAIGIGAALARTEATGRGGRALAVVAASALALLGLRTALDVALGLIP